MSQPIFSSIISTLLPFKIHYILPHEEQNLRDASPFQGFTPGLIGTSDFTPFCLGLPADVRELWATRTSVRTLRIAGDLAYSIIPIDIRFIENLLQDWRIVFACVYSYNQYIENEVAQVNTELPILHASDHNGRATVRPNILNNETLRDYVSTVADALSSKPKWETFYKDIRSTIDDASRPHHKMISLNTRSHLTTEPNECALRSLCCAMKAGPPPAPTGSKQYVRAILRSYDAVAYQRQQVIRDAPGLTEYTPVSTILTVPSVYTERYRGRSLEKLKDQGGDRRIVEEVARQIIRQESYYLSVPQTWIKGTLESPVGKGVITVRQKELKTYTQGVSIVSSSYGAGVLRFPQGVDSSRSYLIAIADCANGNSPHRRFKLNKLARRLDEKYKSIIPNDFLSRLRRQKENIKIIADVPIEWIAIDNLPLCLRHETSRIPTTPGNLFYAQCVRRDKTILRQRDFNDILIVSSFTDDDRLKGLLEWAVNRFSGIVEREQLRITFREVHTEDQLVDAINCFSGPLMIFDGHATGGDPDDVGYIMIAGRPVDMWSLKGKIRVPPIVLLSACATHGIDSSHASPANGFLMLGAQTVVATTLPIDGVQAAVFIGRLVYRIGEYLPIVCQSMDQPLRWSSFFTGLQRMAFASEVLHTAFWYFGIEPDEDRYQRIGSFANHWINAKYEDWFERLVRLTAEVLNLNERSIIDMVQIWCRLTESVTYIQLGNPDQIIILNESASNAVSTAINSPGDEANSDWSSSD